MAITFEWGDLDTRFAYITYANTRISIEGLDIHQVNSLAEELLDMEPGTEIAPKNEHVLQMLGVMLLRKFMQLDTIELIQEAGGSVAKEQLEIFQKLIRIVADSLGTPEDSVALSWYLQSRQLKVKLENDLRVATLAAERGVYDPENDNL